MLLKREGMIGSVEIGRVHDCTLLKETAQYWMPRFDRDAVREHEHWLAPQHYDPESGHIPLPVHSFVLKTPHHNILIDTCVGNDKIRPGSSEMHKLATRYLDRLAALGLTPEDIDYVMCTHLHADHVGWNTRLIGGRHVPTFPNARYVMSKLELEKTRADAALESTPAAARLTFTDSVLPILEARQEMLVEGVHEMLDGLTLRPAPGHTEGTIRIELRSGAQTAIFAGDILHTPIQIPFWEWSSRICWDRAKSAETRRKLLEDCVAEKALLLPGHFCAPHVGRIRERNGTFAIDFGW